MKLLEKYVGDKVYIVTRFYPESGMTSDDADNGVIKFHAADDTEAAALYHKYLEDEGLDEKSYNLDEMRPEWEETYKDVPFRELRTAKAGSNMGLFVGGVDTRLSDAEKLALQWENDDGGRRVESGVIKEWGKAAQQITDQEEIADKIAELNNDGSDRGWDFQDAVLAREFSDEARESIYDIEYMQFNKTDDRAIIKMNSGETLYANFYPGYAGCTTFTAFGQWYSTLNSEDQLI